MPPDSSAPDLALVDAARHGDDAAFAQLVARHHSFVVSFIARSYRADLTRADLEDLGQDTWIRVWRGLARFDGRSSFRTWAVRIAINLVIDRLRVVKRQQRPVALSPAALRRVPTPNGPGQVIAGALRRDLVAALRTLPAIERDIFVRTAVVGEALGVSAAALGIPRPTAKSRYFRARRQLQAALSRAAA